MPSVAAPTCAVSDSPSTLPREAKTTTAAGVFFVSARTVTPAPRELQRNPALAAAAISARAAVVSFREDLTAALISAAPQCCRPPTLLYDRRIVPSVHHD